jgi:acetolactate synthase-1/2/3 large subunit
VYLSIPPEASMQKVAQARFPTVDQLGIARAPAPDPEGAREIAARFVRAKHPFAVVSGSGRDPRTVAALVELCELLGIAVVHSAYKSYLSFPLDHPLSLGSADMRDADAVLVLDADIPWIPGPGAPGKDAWIAVVGLDPVTAGVPVMEFNADLRLASGALNAIRAIASEAKAILSDEDRARIAGRRARIADASHAKRTALELEAVAKASATPIDPLWLGHQVAKLVDDQAIVFDDTLPHNRFVEFLSCRRPGSCFFTPGTSGGWAPGAALGAKLAAPDRDVIAVTGDGFYMFASAAAALWAAKHHGAPYLTVVYQNRSYSTGTARLAGMYPDSYAQKSGFEGGYFDPPIDFAKEAEAAGAYGENVRDPAELAAALARGKAETRKGRPAVISVWLARRLQKD